jgi:excisionase family DNA binding protein
MDRKKPTLTATDLSRPFEGDLAAQYPPVLSPQLLAQLLGRSRKTVYDWLARGRLDAAVRRRGKHVLIWRDRALEILFCGKEWHT